MFVNKAVKFTEAFKYAFTSIPLVIVTPKPTLYQPDKAGLRNYIINLQKGSSRSSHEYPKDIKWLVDGLAAICSVPSHATYEELFTKLVTFITPLAKA